MSILKLTCGFKLIAKSDSFFRHQTIIKGKSLYEAGHVDQVVEVRDSSSQDSKFSGRCLSQVKVSTRYNLWVTVNENGEITAGNCNCVAGIDGKCKHCAALVSYVNSHEDESVTSGVCQWNIPRRVKDYSRGSLITDLFPNKILEVPMKNQSFMDIESCFPDLDCPLFEVARIQKTSSQTGPFLDGNGEGVIIIELTDEGNETPSQEMDFAETTPDKQVGLLHEVLALSVTAKYERFLQVSAKS